MEDARIVELYWERDEAAIAESSAKYGGYCYQIAFRILALREDAEDFFCQFSDSFVVS